MSPGLTSAFEHYLSCLHFRVHDKNEEKENTQMPTHFVTKCTFGDFFCLFISDELFGIVWNSAESRRWKFCVQLYVQVYKFSRKWNYIFYVCYSTEFSYHIQTFELGVVAHTNILKTNYLKNCKANIGKFIRFRVPMYFH